MGRTFKRQGAREGFMARKPNVRHPHRSQSGYKRRMVNGADRYGEYQEGRQLTPDVIGGTTSWKGTTIPWPVSES